MVLLLLSNPGHGVSSGRKTSSRSRGTSRHRVGRLSYMVMANRFTQNACNPRSRRNSYRDGYAPALRWLTIWLALGAFASKSRLTAALSWPTVSKTEKSSRGHALLGNTSRPCRFTTKSFTTTVCSSSATVEQRPERIQRARVLDGRGHRLVVTVRDAAHGLAQDLPRACLGQSGHHVHLAQRRHRPDLVPNQLDELGTDHGRVGAGAGLEHHEAARYLPLDRIFDPDHGTLSHRGMAGQHLFHLAGGQPMAGHVEHIVGAAHDEQVPVRVHVTAVTGQVAPRVMRQVRVDVALVVAPQSGQATGGQRQADDDL